MKTLIGPGFEHTEFLHSVSEGVSADIEKFSSSGLIAIGHLEGLLDQGFLNFFHRNSFRWNSNSFNDPSLFRSLPKNLYGQMLHEESIFLNEDHCPFDHIFQLPYVSRPTIIPEEIL